MNYIEKFEFVLYIRQLQPKTKKDYSGILKHFLVWCGQKKPEDLQHEDLLQYLALPGSASLIWQRIGVLKNFYEFVLGQGFKCLNFPRPERRYRLPEYIPLDKLNLVINSIRNPKQRLLVKIQYALALRVHEVVKIRRKDFIKTFSPHFEKEVYNLRIEGKGARIDEIPVPDETVSEIRAWWRTLKDKPKDYLFPGQFANFYSAGSVQNIMRRELKAHGIENHQPTHCLRHSRAVHLLQAGVDIAFIQKLLRHKSVKTTERYLPLKTEDLRVAFSKADTFLQIKTLAASNLPTTTTQQVQAG